MRKSAWVVMLLMLFVSSCKTTKTSCDAYGEVEYDINKSNLESQKKYHSYTSLR
jgi:hypothetical protein